MAQFEPLLKGLCFPEGPRWHDGRLYFSDMHAKQVMTVDENGRAETIMTVPGQPSGLGWRPDGTMLVVSMVDRKLMAVKGGALETVADLSGIATFHCNDMVVDGKGRAYVGNFGFDLFAPGLALTPETLPTLPKAAIARVDPDGRVHVAARDLAFPNGTVITPDGRTLIVGESIGQRLTAFDVGEDGSLSNRRVWADLPGEAPDGICLDEAGGVWVASAFSTHCLRVEQGGRITHRLAAGQHCYACMLGGRDGRTLFACTAADSHPDAAKKLKSGRIERASAPYARAGWP